MRPYLHIPKPTTLICVKCFNLKVLYPFKQAFFDPAQSVRVRTAREHPRTLVNILIINNLKFIRRLMFG